MASRVKSSKDFVKSNSVATAAVTIFCTLVFFPIFLSILLIWLPFRILIIAFVRLLQPKLQLAEIGLTSLLAVRSTRNRPDGNLVYHLICQGPVSLDQLTHQFQHKVLEFQDSEGNQIYRRLRYFFRPIFQVLFWQEDVKFDLKNHIRIYDFEEPGLALPKGTVTEDDLMRITGGLVVRPYPEGRSPWELLLIPSLKGKGCANLTGMTLRINHGIADGLSGIGLIHRLFGAPAPAPLAKFPQLTLANKAFEAIYIAFRAPYELARFAVEFTDDFNAWNLPQKSYNDDSVSFCSDPIPWVKIKGIMNKYEVNSNAAVYSIIAGALVRMMKDIGHEVPCKLSSLTSYPLPNHPGGLSNHVSYSGFKFNPYKHIGPALVHEVGSQVKAANCLNPLAKVMNVMSNLQSLYPTGIAKRMLVTPNTLTSTHFPGPLEALQDPKFTTLLDVIPAMDTMGLGSITMAVSCAGNLRVGLTVNKAVLPATGGDFGRSFAGHVQDEIEAVF